MKVLAWLRRPRVIDAVVAVLFTIAAMGIDARLNSTAGDEYRQFDALAIVVQIVAGGALAFRRVAPRTTLAVSTAALTVYIARQYTGGPIFIAPVIAMYEVASAFPRRRWLVAIGTASLVLTGVGVVASPERASLLHYVLYLSWAVGAGFLGDASRSRREYLEGLEERNRQLVENQEEEARRRLAEERVRIARDVHDVVAHSLASINVQASAGVHVAARHPEQAVDALAAIKQASSDALNDLRCTLGMLRTESDDAGAVPLTPGAGLDQLDAVVARTVNAGLPVSVRTEGSLHAIPPVIDAAAFRIVQESLANALRHSRASHVNVTLAANGDTLDISVCDDGVGARSVSDGGHGIAGMRERAADVGGSFTVETRPQGGFRVRARLPLHPRGGT